MIQLGPIRVAFLVLGIGVLPGGCFAAPAGAEPPAVETGTAPEGATQPEAGAPSLAAATPASEQVDPLEAVGSRVPDPDPVEVDGHEPAEPAPPCDVASHWVGGVDRLERAWFAPARTLTDRVSRTRRVADELGITSLDPLARAVLAMVSEAPRLERARLAVTLGPDLPLAHMALAQAWWEEGHQRGEVLRAAGKALESLLRNFESRLWLEATVSGLLVLSLAGAAFLMILLRGIVAFPHAAHDLGDWVESSMPTGSRVALLLCPIVLALALGEGALGVALALFGLAFWHAGASQRLALAAAAGLLIVAVHPLTRVAGQRLVAIDRDPVASAVAASETGFLDVLDASRLESAVGDDTLAMQALALHSRRAGNLAEAEARFAPLIERNDADAAILNNAANVRLLRGQIEGAIELYRRAAAEQDSAVVWFNLSQAHGRSIEVDQHERALAVAQSIDADLVGQLTGRLSNSHAGYVADLPVPREALKARLHAASGTAVAEALRRPVAPGALGSDPWLAGEAFAAVGLLAAAVRRRRETSSWCTECGKRLCLRCGTGHPRDDLCEACGRRRAEARDPSDPWESASPTGLGLRRIGIRAAAALGWVVPVIGAGARRPLLGFLALWAGTTALVFAVGQRSVVPDPMAAGDAGPLALSLAAAALAAVYLVVALGLRRTGR